MPAKKKTPTQKTATRKSTPSQPQQTPAQSPLPAVVSALVKFADPERQGIPSEFMTAWRQMPRMIAAT